MYKPLASRWFKSNIDGRKTKTCQILEFVYQEALFPIKTIPHELRMYNLEKVWFVSPYL